jgi:hypothetical protein
MKCKIIEFSLMGKQNSATHDPPEVTGYVVLDMGTEGFIAVIRTSNAVYGNVLDNIWTGRESRRMGYHPFDAEFGYLVNRFL